MPESVSTAPANRYHSHHAQATDAYGEGFKHGTKHFTARVYKGHRQVVDKTKWYYASRDSDHAQSLDLLVSIW